LQSVIVWDFDGTLSRILLVTFDGLGQPVDLIAGEGLLSLSSEAAVPYTVAPGPFAFA
jgi:hypothetical protein